MNRIVKTFATIALALIGYSLFAYNGGYENGLLTDATIGGVTYKGYGNDTVTAREESGATIDANRYAQCKKLKSVNLSGVTSIGDAAFAYSALESLTLPASVKSLGYIAFGGCTNMTSATFASTGWYAANKEPFLGCTKLETITVPGGVPSYGAAFVALFPNLKTIRCPKANMAAWKSLCSTLRVVDRDATYKIVYHKYDGTDAAVTNSYSYGVWSTLRLLPAAWSRRGLTMCGWATTPEKAGAGTVWKAAGASVSTPVAAGGTLHLYAVWQLKSGWYSLKYNKNDGSGTWRAVAYEYGTDTTLPSIGLGLGWSRAGYEFLGWSTSAAKAAAHEIWRGDKGVTKTPTKAGTTLNVYASWRPVTTYKIEFNKNDGSGATYVESFAYGTATALPSYANAKKMGWAKRGFDFKGWATSEANAKAGKVWKADKAKVATAAKVGTTLKVYAVYKIQSDSYGLRLYKNDGTAAFLLVGYAYGVKTRLPSIKNGLKWTRDGYTFKGWAFGKSNADAGKVWKADWAYVSTGVAAGTVADVYALWTKKSACVATVPDGVKAAEDGGAEIAGVGNAAGAAGAGASIAGGFLSGTVVGYDLGTFNLLVGEDGEAGYARMVLDGRVVVGECEILLIDGKNIVIVADDLTYTLKAN